MIEGRANSSAYTVGQAFLGANALEQARGKASAKCLIENLRSIVVGIVPRGAYRHHVDTALVYIILVDQVVAGRRRLELYLTLRQVRTFRPRFKRTSQL